MGEGLRSFCSPPPPTFGGHSELSLILLPTQTFFSSVCISYRSLSEELFGRVLSVCTQEVLFNLFIEMDKTYFVVSTIVEYQNEMKLLLSDLDTFINQKMFVGT